MSHQITKLIISVFPQIKFAGGRQELKSCFSWLQYSESENIKILVPLKTGCLIPSKIFWTYLIYMIYYYLQPPSCTNDLSTVNTEVLYKIKRCIYFYVIPIKTSRKMKCKYSLSGIGWINVSSDLLTPVPVVRQIKYFIKQIFAILINKTFKLQAGYQNAIKDRLINMEHFAPKMMGKKEWE